VGCIVDVSEEISASIFVVEVSMDRKYFLGFPSEPRELLKELPLIGPIGR
jgi:hypothetical protein